MSFNLPVGWKILYILLEGNVKLEIKSLSISDVVNLVRQSYAPRRDKNKPIGEPKKSTKSKTKYKLSFE